MPDPIPRLNAALDGRYRIEGEVGEGGMATVYLAGDLRHDRKVALKVLKPELAAAVGAERFLAEIKTTAGLQHPNILPLFDSGEADGFLFYVMPYVEGESLRDRLNREKQLPVDEAVHIASAVASALHVAHQHGIVHRDIKPGNILLSQGEPLVADFGIALAVGAADASRLTETGMSLGTPYYMSPEQATGEQVVGPPSDTYALGCVLYEMLVGEPPYVARTAQAILGKVIRGAPAAPSTLRKSVPANVDAAIRKALELVPADRFTDTRAFGQALADGGFRYGEPSAAEVRAAAGGGVWRRVGPVAVATTVVFAAVAAWALLRSERPPPVSRYSLAFAPGQEVVDLPRASSSFSVAPGGTAIVYVGPGEGVDRQLWVKFRGELEPERLPDTEMAQSPSISPDGVSVAFEQEGRLRLIPLRGGAATTVADSVRNSPLAWLGGDQVLFVDQTSNWDVRRVSVGGGASEVVLRAPTDLLWFLPTPLPDGRGVLYTSCDAACRTVPELWVHDLRTGEGHLLMTGSLRGWYVDSGHVVFVRPDGAVLALPFDIGTLTATGPAFPVLEGVQIRGNTPDLDVTGDGTLLMMRGLAKGFWAENQEVVWVSRDGVVRPVDPQWRIRLARNIGLALSPDGTRLAIGLATVEGDDVWVKELDDGPLLRLTDDPGEDFRPAWSRDGRSIYFFNWHQGGVSSLHLRRADGAGEVHPVLTSDRGLWEVTWTPDDEWLVARVGGTTNGLGGRNLVAYHVGADTAQVDLVASAYDAVSPKLSPDGRWLAYASQESGEWEIYVRPFPDVASGRTVVSRGGGTQPLWSHSGGELFYRSGENNMMAARVETGGAFRVVERRVLFALPGGFRGSAFATTYDISADDQRFIMVREREAESEGPAQLVLIENWLQELKERGGT